MREIITCDDILGKEAVDPDGAILGIVVKLHIDKLNKTIVGLTIDQGFMKPDIFVGINYIKHFGVEAIFLSKVPHDRYKGLDVITEEGHILGVVKDVIVAHKRIQEIVVSPKKAFNKKNIIVPSSKIKEFGSSVILRKGFRYD